MTYAVAPSKVTAAEVAATMASAMTSTSATASAEGWARQRGQKNHNDNCTAFRHDHRLPPFPVVAPSPSSPDFSATNLAPTILVNLLDALAFCSPPRDRDLRP